MTRALRLNPQMQKLDLNFIEFKVYSNATSFPQKCLECLSTANTKKPTQNKRNKQIWDKLKEIECPIFLYLQVFPNLWNKVRTLSNMGRKITPNDGKNSVDHKFPLRIIQLVYDTFVIFKMCKFAKIAYH